MVPTERRFGKTFFILSLAGRAVARAFAPRMPSVLVLCLDVLSLLALGGYVLWSSPIMLGTSATLGFIASRLHRRTRRY